MYWQADCSHCWWNAHTWRAALLTTYPAAQRIHPSSIPHVYKHCILNGSHKDFFWSLFAPACVSRRIDVTAVGRLCYSWRKKLALAVGIDTCPRMWQAGLWIRCSLTETFHSKRDSARKADFKVVLGHERTAFLFHLIPFRVSAHCVSLSVSAWVRT